MKTAALALTAGRPGVVSGRRRASHPGPSPARGRWALTTPPAPQDRGAHSAHVRPHGDLLLHSGLLRALVSARAGPTKGLACSLAFPRPRGFSHVAGWRVDSAGQSVGEKTPSARSPSRKRLSGLASCPSRTRARANTNLCARPLPLRGCAHAQTCALTLYERAFALLPSSRSARRRKAPAPAAVHRLLSLSQ